MCEPTTIAIAVAATGAVVGGYGAYQSSRAAKDAAKYNAAVSRNNAVIAEQQAKDRLAQGKQEERDFRKKLSLLKGKQRSIYAGSGVVVDEGTPLDILSETAELGEVDALTIRNNAEREAYGFRVQGMNTQAQANLFQSQADNTKPLFDAFSTTLTGASNTASLFATGK